MITEEELAKAKKPAQEAMRLHPFYRGKIEMVPKCPVRDFDDFAIWYTPGVAEPSKAIAANKELVYDYTNKWNTIAIVSDGTRVLGLGNVGPEAGLPVMEGKALLFKYLGGVDAVPICLDTKDPDEIIATTRRLQPSFGGINLEDIANPKCFYILDTLRQQMEIPVWHDDQQGTATVILAGLINALKVVGKQINEVSIAVIGAGAANIAVTRLLFVAGVSPEATVVVDSKGILGLHRYDIVAQRDLYKDKWRLCQTTNAEKRVGNMAEALRGADVCIALSRPGPDVIHPEWIIDMNKDAIVFVCANPTPEIWPQEAKEAGARVVATGRSDFPNQVNNSLVFPGIFRGSLDVRSKTITDEMCLAAAAELARHAEKKGLSEESIVPNMDDEEVYIEVAVAVAMKAQEQGVARLAVSREELDRNARQMIHRARSMLHTLMKEGYILEPPA